MKKLLIPLISIFLLLSLSSCIRFVRSDTLQKYEEIVDTLGKSQLTSDRMLTGTRKYACDSYTGVYAASCDSTDGRDVVFGGASIDERTLYLSGWIITGSGRAQLRVRHNEDVYIISTDKYGFFSKKLSLDSGGSFIMLEYEDFTGKINLVSSYEAAESSI